MEVFSSLLPFNIDNGNFKFHPRCQQLGISHAMFADDLFVFCGAHEDSLRIVMNTLKEFHGFYGLQPNMMKSASYFANVSVALKLSFLEMMGILEGQLPVKYLGVPLISSRLTSTDCLILKEKILARIHGWSHKSLSYGGRVQLIQFALCSIHTYWSSIFVLPQKIIKEIKGALSAFFWV